MGAESEPNTLMTAVIECRTVNAALSEVVGLDKWVSHAASQMVKAYAEATSVADLK